MLFRILILIIISVGTLQIGQAKTVQDLNGLVALAKSHTEKVLKTHYGEDSDIQVSAGNVDHRVRLASCETPLKTEIESGQMGQKNMLVKVSCQAPTHWAIRIPMHIEHFSDIVISQKRIGKDTPICEQDLMVVKKDITQTASGYFESMADIIGQIAKNEIATGMTIKANMIKYPVLIKRGDHVKILVQAPGIKVESRGIAQKDGIKNETIKIKNAKSNTIIEATVQETGVVAVFL